MNESYRYPNEMVDGEQIVLTALLVGVQHKDETPEQAEDLLNELAELTNTLRLKNITSVCCKIRSINNTYVLGSGKAKEICENAQSLEVDVIVINDFLTPSQQRNWETLAECAVIDRQEVILDIFAARAKSNEAILQIALAKETYSLPRLKRQWTHLNRQRGMAGGLGGRAEGEQQLEIDSRLVRDKILKLKQQIAKVQQQREVQRQKRLQRPIPVAAIVGYTNAGKSSLLNAMTHTADTLVENKLFATLDPTVRRITLPGGQDILLADTVGFIRNLPHLLVDAFKSTLEETLLSDYLIEVLDATSSEIVEHHETTQKVLQEIGIERKQTIVLLNKSDLVPDNKRKELSSHFPDALFVSTKTGEGLEELRKELTLQMTALLDEMQVIIPHSRYDIVVQIRKSCSIEAQSYEDDGVHICVRVPDKMKKILEPFVVK